MAMAKSPNHAQAPTSRRALVTGPILMEQHKGIFPKKSSSTQQPAIGPTTSRASGFGSNNLTS